MLSDADALLKLPASNTAARSMAQMFRMGQRLPPIPHLLSVMVQPKKPRRYPDDEAEIKREDQITRLPDDERRKEARAPFSCPGLAGFYALHEAVPSVPCRRMPLPSPGMGRPLFRC